MKQMGGREGGGGGREGGGGVLRNQMQQPLGDAVKLR